MNIAIDFGGTNIKIGLIKDGAVILKTSIPAYSEGGLIQRLPAVREFILKWLSKNQYSLTDCTGIGIATPGLVDAANHTIISINDKYADAVGFHFQEWSKMMFSLPCILENDARAALIGETTYGVARGETDAILMTFGTGIGTAAIMNGQILRGRHHQAGILGGHLATDIHGETCNCGNHGCLEAQASHWALDRIVRKHPRYEQSTLASIPKINYLTILEAAKSGDSVGADILKSLISHWSAGIVNLIHAYDPDIVILSGGLMKSQADILPLLQKQVYQMAWTPWGNVRFTVAEDPDTSVLLGVSRLLEMEQTSAGS